MYLRRKSHGKRLLMLGKHWIIILDHRCCSGYHQVSDLSVDLGVLIGLSSLDGNRVKKSGFLDSKRIINIISCADTYACSSSHPLDKGN